MSRAAVIGAGFGGIAAALRLRAKGYQVTLVDRAQQVGGRAQVYTRNGFTFDAGPTVITAPFLLTELFALFDKRIQDYVNIVPVEPWYRFYYPDGDCFNYGGTLTTTLEEIKRINPRDAAGYRNLLRESQEMFDIGFTGLADKPFHELSKMIQQLPKLIQFKCFRSVWQLVSQHLEHDKLRQAFSIQPLLVGGNPFDTTCIYNLIHFLERKWGIHFAMGGTGALVRAMEKLMRETGIDIQLNTTVERLQVTGGRVTALITDQQRSLKCDLAVSNVDPKHLYKNMLAQSEQTLLAKMKTQYAKLSMGLYVLFFGTTRKFEDIAHHTIWLGKRYRSLLHDIFHGKVLAADFSLYVHRPTATDPSMAPEGCDSFYVLSPVPNLLAKVAWNEVRRDYANRIIDALHKTIMPGLKHCIVEQFDMTPVEFKEDYLSEQGSGFSIAPTLTQSAWFRYHNQGEGPENLYLVGAGTHPGAGIPGVLSSAKVLESLIPPAVQNLVCAGAPVQEPVSLADQKAVSVATSSKSRDQ